MDQIRVRDQLPARSAAWRAADAADDRGWSDIALVPPRRLGSLLSDVRAARGLTLEQVVERSDGRFTLVGLASIERGSTPVDDATLGSLVDLYGLDATSVVPARSRLIVDLEEGVMSVDRHRRQFDDALPDYRTVLERYVSLVHSMRHVAPGRTTPIRVDDLDVLGRALRVGPEALRADLDALMSDSRATRWRSAVLTRKVLVPAAGVLVAVVASGALILVQGTPAQGEVRQDSAPVTRQDPTRMQASTPVEVGDAVVQERLGDGSPGPVQIRHN